MTDAAFSCHCEAYEIGRGNPFSVVLRRMNLKRQTIVFGNRPESENPDSKKMDSASKPALSAAEWVRNDNL